MQIIHSHGNIVEKVLRDREGRLIRARFFVYENAGRIKGRLLDFVQIETLKGVAFELVGIVKQKLVRFLNTVRTAFTSGFFSTEILYFSGSKPRAPTFG